MSLLSEIQQKLKAPKGQLNKFGNYRYRSCEDILEALKPLLGTASLIIADDIVQLGDRYYVKATATLWDDVGHGTSWTATAFAREALDKKGMDDAQITGSASSYARKYALNGLFLIDDTKDADSMDNKHEAPEKPSRANVRMVSEINQLKTPGAAQLWWDANERDINELPEEQKGEVSDQYEAKLKGIEEGTAVEGPFVFESTDASRKWAVEFESRLGNCQSPIAVNNLVAASTRWLSALKGQVDSVPDKEIMRKKIHDKRNSFDVTRAG